MTKSLPVAPYNGAVLVTLNSSMQPVQELTFGSWDNAWVGRDPNINDTPLENFIDADQYRFYIKLIDTSNEYAGKNTLQVNVKSYETAFPAVVNIERTVTVSRSPGTNTFLSKSLLLVSDARDCVHLPVTAVDRVFNAGLFGKVEISLVNPLSQTNIIVAQTWFQYRIKEIKVHLLVLTNRFGPACLNRDAKVTAAADQFYNASRVYARLGINVIAVERTNFTPNQLVETRTQRGIGPIYVVNVSNDGTSQDYVDCCDLGGSIDRHEIVCEWYNRQDRTVRMFVANDLGSIHGCAYPMNYSLAGKTSAHNDSFFISQRNHNLHSFTSTHEIGHLLAGDAVHCVENPNGYDDVDPDWEYRLMRTTTNPLPDCTASKWIKDSYIQTWRAASNHVLF
jgi:hypothetical protein